MILFLFSSRRRDTRFALVTGVQTCALTISLSDFWPETRPVLIAFMSVWRVTPTFSDASLRVRLIVSLAVKLAWIVSIYRLHHHRAMYWMHEVCCLGP